jgi:4-carboxymuconolactone decarboxylase
MAVSRIIVPSWNLTRCQPGGRYRRPLVSGRMADEQRSAPAPVAGPRIAPLSEDELDDDARDLLAQAAPPGARAVNIFATLVRAPGLFRRWLPFGGKLLRGKLPARDRELAILRTAWLCEAPYEWAQHVVIARAAGLTDAQIEAVATGPDDPSWAAADVTLLSAVDQLHDDSVIDDETWAALAERYDDRQMIELPMLIGHYHMIAYTLNSLGVQLEPGLEARGAEA